MKTGFFEETAGVRSWMRLVSFLLVLFAMAMSAAIGAVGLLGVAHGTGGDLMGVVGAVVACAGSLSALGLGAKITQKGMEPKEPVITSGHSYVVPDPVPGSGPNPPAPTAPVESPKP